MQHPLVPLYYWCTRVLEHSSTAFLHRRPQATAVGSTPLQNIPRDLVSSVGFV